MGKTAKRIVLVGVIMVSGLLGGCSSCSRMGKSISSDMGGGLNRTVTVYDYSGNELRKWSGKFDVSESENEVYFDLNGKRVIVHGGIVINEEN